MAIQWLDDENPRARKAQAADWLLIIAMSGLFLFSLIGASGLW
jgi:hypothetical protein